MNDLTQQVWQITKALFVIVQQQQASIIHLHESQYELTAALAKQFGWEPPEPPPESSAEEVDALKRGLAELEKMFGGNEEDGK
jgi:hypothetical protein